ncbi:Immunity protein (plasmid) [Mycetohabitans rhizoxinica HKI 454]|uniref:Immunity protein n=2 Tax=Burkholderiaceae TaxID=119060 RepID=E5AVE4_MYCRK|nr:Immunity protein [Mycetohabitans rhizoxinica HKI 454]
MGVRHQASPVFVLRHGAGSTIVSIMRITIIQLIQALAALLLYFAPSIVADRRKRPDTLMLALFNVCLGWTVLGWLLALHWALGPVARALDAGELTVRRRTLTMRMLSNSLTQRARRTDARDAQREADIKAARARARRGEF